LIFDASGKISVDTRALLIPNYMTDWHVNNNNSFQDTVTSVSDFKQEQMTFVEKNNVPVDKGRDGSMNSAWPMFSHDVTHTSRSPYSTTNNSGVEIWRMKSDGSGAIWSSAITDNNGIIYIGTKGSTASLYALYPNGTRKWRFIANGPIWATPAIAENGDIYCTTWGGLGYLQAITQNGIERWRFNQQSDSASAPTINSDGTIYFGTDSHNIFAVNPDGTEKWRYTTGFIVMGSPAIGLDGAIYIGSGDHYLYALNPNGTLRWQFATGGEIKGSASIAPDGTIYVPSFGGYFYALYPNGTMKWKASTGGIIASAGVALAQDGTIYVGTEILRAYYPNGTLKWSADVQGDIYGTVPAVSADGTIYVSASGSLVAVNPDGSEKWRQQLSTTQVRSSPSIGLDDWVYVGSEDPGMTPHGYLHAFGSGEPKKILIEQPESGKRYLFGVGLGKTLSGNTFIIGSVNVKIHAYSWNEIESVHFSIDGIDQYNLTTPPFEWRMNQRYGNIFPLTHTITVTGYYSGNYTWSESIDVKYLHLFNI
jgi:outer membrane protein assembly factor BamB